MHLSAAPSFHPPSSLLGRFVGRWVDDERQAVSVYIVVAALVLVVASLAGQWGWVLWGTASGSPSLGYFAAQVVGGVIVGAACLLGWRRPLHVHADHEKVTVRRGAQVLALSYDAIRSAERITAADYHRHWQRYAATRAFVNRQPDELLLLRTADGPVVLGLDLTDLDRLGSHIAERLARVHAHRLTRAA